MPQFQTDKRIPTADGTVGPDASAASSAIGGIAGAIPFLNVIAPGLAQTIASADSAQTRQLMLQNAQNIAQPSYDDGSGIEARYAGDFNPEMYASPESADASMIGDSAEGRAAQLAALAEMQGMANQAADSTYALGRRNSEMDARQLANSREGAIRMDAMRRGQLGGAADMIARQQAAQAAANQNLSGGMQSANLQALQQLAGMQAAGVLAGQLRGQDLQRNAGNAGIANQFELYNVGNRNETSRANTGLGNAAQLRNLGAQQGFMDRSTGLEMDKLGIRNQNRRQGFGDQMTKFNAIQGALSGDAAGTEKAAKDGREAGKEGWNNFKDLAKMMGGGM